MIKMPAGHAMKNLLTNTELIPYCDQDGEYAFSKSHLCQIYRRIIREDTARKVFLDGSVQNSRDFIEFFEKKKHHIYIVQYQGNEVGFFWTNEFNGNSVFITYCMYMKYWGEDSVTIGKNCIEQIFSQKNKFGDYRYNIILGLTPVDNTLALKFLTKIGMKIVGTIPGIIADYYKQTDTEGVISYICRNQKSKAAFGQFFKHLLFH